MKHSRGNQEASIGFRMFSHFDISDFGYFGYSRNCFTCLIDCILRSSVATVAVYERLDCGQNGCRIYSGFGREILRRGVCVGQSVW